jgi:hypothetical protein
MGSNETGSGGIDSVASPPRPPAPTAPTGPTGPASPADKTAPPLADKKRRTASGPKPRRSPVRRAAELAVTLAGDADTCRAVADLLGCDRDAASAAVALVEDTHDGRARAVELVAAAAAETSPMRRAVVLSNGMPTHPQALLALLKFLGGNDKALPSDPMDRVEELDSRLAALPHRGRLELLA